jgi:hypothetical protein
MIFGRFTTWKVSIWTVWNFRKGQIRINLLEMKMKPTPLKAIKKHCLECSGYEKKQVRECLIKDCVLFPYRLGSNPNRKGCTLKKGIRF